MNGRRRILYFAPLALIGLALFIAAGGFVVQGLWNWLGPVLFGVPRIAFWQALGLLLLCRILFGGFGLHGGGARGSMRRNRGERVADRVAVRWDGMSPEERERFRQRLRERLGFDPTGGSGTA